MRPSQRRRGRQVLRLCRQERHFEGQRRARPHHRRLLRLLPPPLLRLLPGHQADLQKVEVKKGQDVKFIKL